MPGTVRAHGLCIRFFENRLHDQIEIGSEPVAALHGHDPGQAGIDARRDRILVIGSVKTHHAQPAQLLDLGQHRVRFRPVARASP
jgi:hypothetical protein